MPYKQPSPKTWRPRPRVKAAMERLEKEMGGYVNWNEHINDMMEEKLGVPPEAKQ